MGSVGESAWSAGGCSLCLVVEGVPVSKTFISLSQGSDRVFVVVPEVFGHLHMLVPCRILSNQKTHCPSCGMVMLGKDIDRNLERSCQQAPSGLTIISAC
jgi:hypothetical protein